MKNLVFILLLAFVFTSCSRNDKYNYSAIDDLIGVWSLQSKFINETTPLDIEESALIITDDNDIRDFKGNYEFISEDASSGQFALDLSMGDIVFTTTNGEVHVAGFYLNNITMVFNYRNEDGAIIQEVWVKN